MSEALGVEVIEFRDVEGLSGQASFGGFWGF